MTTRETVTKQMAADRRRREKAAEALEVTVPEADLKGWHRVFYRATQVERSLPCYEGKVKVGQRIAVLQPMAEFIGPTVPESKFYVGTITRIYGNPDDPIMSISFDGGPGGALGIDFGVHQYSKFCIPLPAKKTKKPK